MDGCRQRYGEDDACPEKIHEAEILDELKADDPGLNITVDDVRDDEEVGEDADDDDDGDEEDLDVVRNQVDARRVAWGHKVCNFTENADRFIKSTVGN